MLRRARRRLFWQVLNSAPQGLSARLSYLAWHGRLPNLATPRRFSERVFVQKLRGDHGAFADLSDKVKVKDFVAARVGPAFVNPNLWHGPALPPREERTWPLPFVLKANHGSMMNALVRDPRDLDWDRLEPMARAWMAKDWPRGMIEDWYNRIERRLLVEPLLEDGSADLRDYKVFVFSGRALFVQVDRDRFAGHTRRFYDRDWRPQPFRVVYPPAEDLDPRPRHLDAILWAAEALGTGLDFVRVDFYDLPDGPKFGEMTFAPGAGLQSFDPDRFDFVLGGLWEEHRAARSAAPARPARPARSSMSA